MTVSLRRVGRLVTVGSDNLLQLRCRVPGNLDVCCREICSAIQSKIYRCEKS